MMAKTKMDELMEYNAKIKKEQDAQYKKDLKSGKVKPVVSKPPAMSKTEKAVGWVGGKAGAIKEELIGKKYQANLVKTKAKKKK